MTALHFAHPAALAALLLAPVLASLILYGDRRRRAALAHFAGAPLRLTVNSRRRGMKRSLLIAAAVLVAIALARPVRSTPGAPLPETGDIVFLLDVSRSMFARDVDPDRLRRAKEVASAIARQAAAKWSGERVSLIAFAGSVAVICPLTVDGEYFRESLDGAGPESVAFGGSRIADALHFALRYGFDDIRRGAKDLILLTDGGDQGGPSSVAQEFNGSGVRLTVIGVGDPAHEVEIPISQTDNQPILYGGVPVLTRLDGAELRAFGGAYFEAGPLFRPAEVVERLAARAGTAPVNDEGYPFLLALAVVLLAAEFTISDRSRHAVARGAAAAMLCICPLSAQSAAEWVKQGNEVFGARQYETAARLYRNAAEIEPASPAVNFDLGIAEYRAGDFAAAQSAFQAAAGHARDTKLKAKSLLGAGNAQYRMALADSSASGIAQLEMAIASYVGALKADPNLPDAKHNLDIARQKLEELKRLRRQKAAEDMARSSMRRPQAAPTSAAEILQNARKMQQKPQPFRRQVPTDW